MNLLASARDRGSDPDKNPYTGLINSALGNGGAVAIAERPSSVLASDWDNLAANVARTLDTGTVDGRLHHAVHTVVRAMREARAPWDTVYLALASALAPGESPTAPTPSGMEQHPSRGAALVAHMHCWADCVRLEEIERDA